eukprot:TRINITY_DN34511_c0_g1_i3.p1 TRINITY_DN34511_c0_g1~~TRINITY_DN34511_c0_g1_i3.p1  ORF type:complete len:347 (+),score=31.75 TRINITY_DN34511_c0_g1_i3:754-1794(+)
MFEFSSQDLAGTVWAFAKVSMLDEPLISGIARSALTRIRDIELNSLIAISDALLRTDVSSQCKEITVELRRRVASLARRLPSTLEDESREAYPRLMSNLRTATLGIQGSGLLLTWADIPSLPEEIDGFHSRATRTISGLGRTSSRSTSEATHSFAEWNVRNVLKSTRLNGAMIRTSGNQDAALKVTQMPLRPVRLTASSYFIDRRLCSEFQLLSALTNEMLTLTEDGSSSTPFPPVPLHIIDGNVSLMVSRPPCVSCLGALVQFKRLFPEVDFSVGFPNRIQSSSSRCKGQSSRREADQIDKDSDQHWNRLLKICPALLVAAGGVSFLAAVTYLSPCKQSETDSNS